jgi:hypothetical protein
VHPDLPTWGDGDNRGNAIPRIARLSKTEAASTPSWHAQTIAGSRTATMEDAREKMMLASASGASALMLVSGDGGCDGGSNEKLTSVALLREARSIHWFPYGPVGVVNVIPYGLFPAHLSAHPSL